MHILPLHPFQVYQNYMSVQIQTSIIGRHLNGCTMYSIFSCVNSAVFPEPYTFLNCFWHLNTYSSISNSVSCMYYMTRISTQSKSEAKPDWRLSSVGIVSNICETTIMSACSSRSSNRLLPFFHTLLRISSCVNCGINDLTELLLFYKRDQCTLDHSRGTVECKLVQCIFPFRHWNLAI